MARKPRPPTPEQKARDKALREATLPHVQALLDGLMTQGMTGVKALETIRWATYRLTRPDSDMEALGVPVIDAISAWTPSTGEDKSCASLQSADVDVGLTATRLRKMKGILRG